MAIFNLS